MRSAWRMLTKKASYGFRLHDLRHRAITQLAENGASDSTVMAIAGRWREIAPLSRSRAEHGIENFGGSL
jgi:hypothetical protein